MLKNHKPKQLLVLLLVIAVSIYVAYFIVGYIQTSNANEGECSIEDAGQMTRSAAKKTLICPQQ